MSSATEDILEATPEFRLLQVSSLSNIYHYVRSSIQTSHSNTISDNDQSTFVSVEIPRTSISSVSSNQTE